MQFLSWCNLSATYLILGAKQTNRLRLVCELAQFQINPALNCLTVPSWLTVQCRQTGRHDERFSNLCLRA
jgi:hypothetical protein